MTLSPTAICGRRQHFMTDVAALFSRRLSNFEPSGKRGDDTWEFRLPTDCRYREHCLTAQVYAWRSHLCAGGACRSGAIGSKLVAK